MYGQVTESSLCSLLCIPLLDKYGQSIAIVQLLNKTTTHAFTEQDKMTFQVNFLYNIVVYYSMLHLF